MWTIRRVDVLVLIPINKIQVYGYVQMEINKNAYERQGKYDSE
jgi:hypothetical protein